MTDSSYPLPDSLVTVSQDWLGGAPCFSGRRVPVKALFDFLKAGHALDEFLHAYPSVSREHAAAVIDLTNRSLGRPAA